MKLNFKLIKFTQNIWYITFSIHHVSIDVIHYASVGDFQCCLGVCGRVCGSLARTYLPSYIQTSETLELSCATEMDCTYSFHGSHLRSWVLAQPPFFPRGYIL